MSELLDKREIADYLRVSIPTIVRWDRVNRIPSTWGKTKMNGPKRLYDPDSVIRALGGFRYE